MDLDDKDSNTASLVAQQKERVVDLGRGSTSKSLLQSPKESESTHSQTGNVVVASTALPSTSEEICPLAGVSGVAHSGERSADTPGEGQKVLSKSAKRRLRRKLISGSGSVRPQISQSSAEEKSKDAGRKRQRSAVGTPSPATDIKKRKSGEGKLHSGSYALAVSGIKMAIVKESFPSGKMLPEDESKIKNDLLTRFDSIPDGDQIPRVTATSLQNGALIVQCDDDFTSGWIRSAFHNNAQVVEGEALRVLRASELPKPVKVAFKTKDDITEEPMVLLRRLNRFNPKLKATEWRVLGRKDEPHSRRWIFEVDCEAAEAIRLADYTVHTGVDRGFFKILRDPNKKAATPVVNPGGADDTGEKTEEEGMSSDDAPTSSKVSSIDITQFDELDISSNSDDTLQPMSDSEADNMLAVVEEELSSSLKPASIQEKKAS